MTYKANILVMDDEDAILELIQSALSRLGYRITCARDGAEGLKKFAAETLPTLEQHLAHVRNLKP